MRSKKSNHSGFHHLTNIFCHVLHLSSCRAYDSMALTWRIRYSNMLFGVQFNKSLQESILNHCLYSYSQLTVIKDILCQWTFFLKGSILSILFIHNLQTIFYIRKRYLQVSFKATFLAKIIMLYIYYPITLRPFILMAILHPLDFNKNVFSKLLSSSTSYIN